MFRCCFKPKIVPEENIVKNHMSNTNINQYDSDRPSKRSFAELVRPSPVIIARPNTKSDEDIAIKKK